MARWINPATGVAVGAVLAAGIAVVLLIAPVAWFEDLLDATRADLGAFLVRRYAASATAALFVMALGTARSNRPRRVALQALATWFGVQGAIAVWGIASGSVGGLTWLAVVADPSIAAAFLMLARRADEHHGLDARSSTLLRRRRALSGLLELHD